MKRKAVPSVYEAHNCRRCSDGFWTSDKKQKFCKKCIAEMRNEGVCVGAC